MGIDFIDTHSLSMTKQVTASAAMTLAVLMSSLNEKITQSGTMAKMIHFNQ